jgi:hypothetical protein
VQRPEGADGLFDERNNVILPADIGLHIQGTSTKRPPFLRQGSRQFSTSRFSLSSTTPNASVFRRELRSASREGR